MNIKVVEIPIRLKKWLINNPKVREWIETENWGSLYENCMVDLSNFATGKLTALLLEAGVDPTPNLTSKGNTAVPDAYMYKCISVEKVCIPEGITVIGDDAFKGCTSLKEVELPSTIKEIGESAFFHCLNLERIDLTKGPIEKIRRGAFAHTSLKEVAWPGTAKDVHAGVFNSCEQLEKIQLMHGVRAVHAAAFSNCSKLRILGLPTTIISIEIPDSIREIQYAGTKAQWENVEVFGAENLPHGATVHCMDGSIFI